MMFILLYRFLPIREDVLDWVRPVANLFLNTKATSLCFHGAAPGFGKGVHFAEKLKSIKKQQQYS